MIEFLSVMIYQYVAIAIKLFTSKSLNRNFPKLFQYSIALKFIFVFTISSTKKNF